MYDYLHMGNGDHSKAKCYDLIDDLTKAFATLCTLQQMSMHQVRELTDIEKKAELNDIENMQESVEDTAVKIFMQLTGCKKYSELRKLAKSKLNYEDAKTAEAFFEHRKKTPNVGPTTPIAKRMQSGSI